MSEKITANALADHKFPLSAFLISLVIYCVIYAFTPRVVEYFLNQENFALLNALAGRVGDYPLDFYIGQIENRIAGPLKMILSGMMFLMIGFRYLINQSIWKMTGVVFLYFIFTRPEILFYPPFGESVTAPFSDAVWLVRHSLNYFELHEQVSKTLGGLLYYPGSIYSLFAAVMLYILPGAAAFNLTMHLMTFFMAAVIVAVCREVLRYYFDEKESLVGAVVLLSVPVYQCMSEMINMEMPFVFFAVMSFYYMVKDKIYWASAAAVISMLIKLPGAAVCVVLFIYSLFMVSQVKQNKEKLKYFILGSSGLIISVGKLALRLILRDGQTKQNSIELLNGVWNILILPETFIFAVVSMVFLCGFIIKIIKKESLGRQCIIKHKILLLSWIMSAVWFGMYINFSVMGPRYKLLLYPFLVIVLLISLKTIFSNQRKILIGSLLALIFWNFLCSYGFNDSRKVKPSVYGYNPLERSLEYRNMLKLQMKLSVLIEDKYSDFIIGAPHVIAQGLHFRELGYVSKNMDIVIYGVNPTHGLLPVPPMSQQSLLNVHWIAFDSNPIPNLPFSYPIDEKDVILEHLWMGDRNVYVFQGGYAIEKMRQIISRMN